MPLIVPDEEVRSEKRKKMQEKLEKILTPEKISLYVKSQMNGRNKMLASELPLEQEDTFIRMIYIRLYGQRKNMNYRLELKGIVEKEGFRFRDFEIVSKERGK